MNCKPDIQHELLAAAGHRYCWWCGEGTGGQYFVRDRDPEEESQKWAEIYLYVGDGEQWVQWMADFKAFCEQRKKERAK